MRELEYFNLCKSVYKATGWDDDTLKHYLGGIVYDRQLFESDLDGEEKTRGSYVPLYTSDYLLSILPWSTVCSGPNKDMFGTWLNGKPDETFQEADTPIKALLKLTLELSKKGLLDAKDN